MADTFTRETMPDQTGRTVVITGANSGIGFAAAEAFASAGAEVVMACRSLERGRAARKEIEAENSDVSLGVRELDLADLDSIARFTETFRTDHDELHVLCNNAGVMAIPRRQTADGFEQQFGVNHLGHFALTARLFDPIQASTGDRRIVTQSSNVHERGHIDFDDLQGEDSYGPWRAYAQSKLANLLFAYELDRRLEAADSTIRSVACHPGYADTELQARGPEMQGSRLRLWGMRLANTLFAQSPAQGALPMLYAATASEVDGGAYIGPGGLLQMRGPPETQRSSERSYDETAAERLWQRSEALTGVSVDLSDPASE